MIKILRNLLLLILNDIDSGASNITENQQKEIIDFINKVRDPYLSKIEAANYINVSRATFDNYIKRGLIPKGTKRVGWKELSWNKSDLDKYLKHD